MKTRDIVQVGLYAAIIYLGIIFFKIPVGAQMIHIGNALVAVGLLVFGFRKGAIAAMIGLGLFDVLNGYASVAWITVLESLIVAVVIYLIFEVLMSKNDTAINIIIVAIIVAVAKIIINLIKYTFFRGMLVAGLTFEAALSQAIISITGSFGSAAVTAILVPILYPIVKRIAKESQAY